MTTVINHSIRIKLGLSLLEYTTLDMIRESKTPITFGQYKKLIATEPQIIHDAYGQLLSKGFILNGKTTDKWNSHFADNDDLLSELWVLHNVGNKQKAKDALIQALKVDTFDNIKKGLISYKEFRQQTEQHPLHLSSFLNHKNKEWQTQRDVSLYKKKEVVAESVNTGPKSVWDK